MNAKLTFINTEILIRSAKIESRMKLKNKGFL